MDAINICPCCKDFNKTKSKNLNVIKNKVDRCRHYWSERKKITWNHYLLIRIYNPKAAVLNILDFQEENIQ